MKQLNLVLFFFFWATLNSFAQLKTHSFEEAEKLEQQQPKPIFVFVHTSWCKYCKMMENSTFKNPEVVQLLNDNFYFVSLDAESKEPIIIKNRTFTYKPKGKNTGIHELAEELATVDGNISYPTFSILDKNNAILLQISEFTDAKTMIVLLKEAADFH
ncbi:MULTISPECIES: thioredoxin family protein [Flavobacterium]|uniref:thioredoxin family protein n=1 Tax=Flavobacterium TaxID=237 RepID=UPI001FCBC1F9|nr:MULTISPECIES: thioredoxin family protein [Flavobacterium]UOK43258.1 thioredoxin domain-containing protein [Flavobacterium enshiense]